MEILQPRTKLSLAITFYVAIISVVKSCDPTRHKRMEVENMKNNFAVILADRHKKILDVHKATGISKYTLTKLYYERSTNPTSNTILKIAEYLECSVDELLGLRPYVVSKV